MTANVSLTKHSLQRLRNRYREAVNNKEDSFVFDFGDGVGREMLTNYAKYMIEFAEHQFKHGGKR